MRKTNTSGHSDQQNTFSCFDISVCRIKDYRGVPAYRPLSNFRAHGDSVLFQNRALLGLEILFLPNHLCPIVRMRWLQCFNGKLFQRAKLTPIQTLTQQKLYIPSPKNSNFLLVTKLIASTTDLTIPPDLSLVYLFH